MIHSLIMGDHVPVRLSGWLYFNPEHPGDVGVTRVHALGDQSGDADRSVDRTRWVPLDSPGCDLSQLDPDAMMDQHGVQKRLIVVHIVKTLKACVVLQPDRPSAPGM